MKSPACRPSQPRLAAALLLLLLGLATAGPAAAEPAGQIRTLLITGGHGFEEAAFYQVFQTNTDLIFAHTSHAKTNGGTPLATAFDQPGLLNHEVVVLYDMPRDLTDSQKAGFRSLFDHGVGLVVLHHALVSYQHWPEYERIIGGRYPEADGKGGVVTDAVGYQHDVEVPVVIVARDHPITAGLTDFTIHDEIYWGFRTAPNLTVLATTTHPKSGKPLAWCRTEGRSRIVYLQFGHDHQAYENPNYQRLLAQSIRWAAHR